MATKWKNIINDKVSWAKKNWKLPIGIVPLIFTIVVLVSLSPEILTFRTTTTWFVGLVFNVLIGISMVLITTYLLAHKYSDWTPTGEDYYIEWKKQWKHQQKTIITIGVIIFLSMFLAYMLILRRFVDYGGWYYYLANYSTAYLLIATIILQFIICEICIIRFMKSKLDPLMECMTQINRNQLAAAMEIERESIEKAAKSERLKVDLISNVSHDLKTPLTSMVGYIELLKKEDLDELQKDYVDVISNKAEKLKEMIESLFSLAKASSGNVKLNMEPIKLNTLIEQIFADMSTQIETSDLQFVQLLTEDDTEIVSDNMHMYRICQNLIENTLKYSALGTRVFVKTWVEEILGRENVRLEITNTAGYMMDFDKEDIVERFARGDKARTSDGNGLGLAIVSTYTGALGGAFDINIDCDQFKAVLSFPRENLTSAS